jgi:hypothetical protein
MYAFVKHELEFLFRHLTAYAIHGFGHMLQPPGLPKKSKNKDQHSHSMHWDVLISSILAYGGISLFFYYTNHSILSTLFFVITVMSSLADSNICLLFRPLSSFHCKVQWIDRTFASCGVLAFCYYFCLIGTILLPAMTCTLSLYFLFKGRFTDCIETWKMWHQLWHYSHIFPFVVLVWWYPLSELWQACIIWLNELDYFINCTISFVNELNVFLQLFTKIIKIIDIPLQIWCTSKHNDQFMSQSTVDYPKNKNNIKWLGIMFTVVFYFGNWKN